MRRHHHSIFHTLALFGSMSTLICCAMPALFVTIGAGAALAGLVSTAPQLVWLSEHKIPLFIFAACMLSLSGFLQHRARHAPCPTDRAQAEACRTLRTRGRLVFFFSLGCYAVGFFFAFIAPHLR